MKLGDAAKMLLLWYLVTGGAYRLALVISNYGNLVCALLISLYAIIAAKLQADLEVLVLKG